MSSDQTYCSSCASPFRDRERQTQILAPPYFRIYVSEKDCPAGANSQLCSVIDPGNSEGERLPCHVLYADSGIQNICHDLFMQPALGERYDILPVRSSHEREIRRLWTQEQFHCVFLVLNNIVVPQSHDTDERISGVLALVSWMRERSSATIIALSGWRPSEYGERALRSGADRFFPLPCSPEDVREFLVQRFASPAGTYV